MTPEQIESLRQVARTVLNQRPAGGTIRSQSCTACPYRRDVPSGLWAEHEYDKLPPYDEPTGSQPFGPFMCHATPEAYCHGWAVVHEHQGRGHELLALRMERFAGEVPPPDPTLFASGAEAAEHGKRDIDAPSEEAEATMARLMRKYDRLRPDGGDDDAAAPEAEEDEGPE